MQETMIPKWNPQLVKIANFVSQLNGKEDGYFEWSAPTAFDHLNLKQPLKLEAIYVKWDDISSTAIQLEFGGGLKSELFDAERSEAKNSRMISLKGLKITSFRSRVEGNRIRSLIFYH